MSFSLNTTGGVASRFVSQKDLDEAKANKDKEWAEAYARIGEAPPPRPQEEEYDPRSLFEKLQHNKDVKREQWDEKMKMANQFRGLDSEEVNFLEAHQREKHAEEAARKRADDDVLEAFRQAQNREPSPPPALTASGSSSKRPSAPNASTTATAVKPKPKAKSAKSFLPPGVIVKKKTAGLTAAGGAKASTASPAPTPSPIALSSTATTADSSQPSKAAPANDLKDAAEPSKKRPLPLGLDLGDSSDESGESDNEPGPGTEPALGKKARFDAK